MTGTIKCIGWRGSPLCLPTGPVQGPRECRVPDHEPHRPRLQRRKPYPHAESVQPKPVEGQDLCRVDVREEVIEEFAFIDHRANLELCLQPVGTYYGVTLILTSASGTACVY